MRKILLLFFGLILAYSFISSGKAYALEDGGQCFYCPQLSGRPNYVGTPRTGDGNTVRNSDPANYEYLPRDLDQNKVSQHYCEYAKADSLTYIAIPSSQDMSSEACRNKACSNTEGCTGNDTDPGQCTTLGKDPCQNTSECRTSDNKCSTVYCVVNDTKETLCSSENFGRSGCSCQPKDEPPLCPDEETCNEEPVPNEPLSSPCKDPGENGCDRIETAFGPVATGASGFTRWLLGFLLSISGGIIIIIIIISGYRLMTSSGDPEKVKNARDQLTAAIVGLLFIIFSLVILELITRDILGLPGFGSP